MYLRDDDVPGQQQDEQRGVERHVVRQPREQKHQAADRTTGRLRHHQTEAGEAGYVDHHVFSCHLTRCEEVHTVLSHMSHTREALTAVCTTRKQNAVTCEEHDQQK